MNVKKMSIASVVILAVFFGAIIWLTQPLAALADDYFVHISQGEFDQAYQLMSTNVHALDTRDEFYALFQEPVLQQYKSSTWTNRTIEGNTGYIQGVIKTSDPCNPKMNATMNFIKEDGQWKINYLELW